MSIESAIAKLERLKELLPRIYINGVSIGEEDGVGFTSALDEVIDELCLTSSTPLSGEQSGVSPSAPAMRTKNTETNQTSLPGRLPGEYQSPYCLDCGSFDICLPPDYPRGSEVNQIITRIKKREDDANRGKN